MSLRASETTPEETASCAHYNGFAWCSLKYRHTDPHRFDPAVSAPRVPEETLLLRLVDVVWNTATESMGVPSTDWARRMIAEARASLVADHVESPAVLPTADAPTAEAILLPCPFCGFHAGEETIVDSNEGVAYTPWYQAGCQKCDFWFAGSHDCDEAITQWNRRA